MRCKEDLARVMFAKIRLLMAHSFCFLTTDGSTRPGYNDLYTTLLYFASNKDGDYTTKTVMIGSYRPEDKNERGLSKMMDELSSNRGLTFDKVCGTITDSASVMKKFQAKFHEKNLLVLPPGRCTVHLTHLVVSKTFNFEGKNHETCVERCKDTSQLIVQLLEVLTRAGTAFQV